MMSLFGWIGTDCQSSACEIQLSLAIIMAVVLPIIVGAAVIGLIAHLIRRQVKARQAGDIKTARRLKRTIIAIVLVLVLFFGTMMAQSAWYEWRKKQRVVNARFNIYSTSEMTIDAEQLSADTTSTTVPHVNSRLKTPLGEINVIQGEFDNQAGKLFVPPDKCDIDELNDYFGVWGRAEKQTTTKACRSIESNSGWVILTTSETGEFGNRTPYAAKKDNTIIIFKAYESTAGEFSGTPQQAEKYILDFLDKASKVDPKTLN